MSDTPYYVDADGHLVEHPTGIQDYAPAELRGDVWHVETDADGLEWVVMGDAREPANVYAASAVAGFSDEEKQQAWAGQMRYSQIPGGAYDTKERLAAMDEDGIDISVLYPTMLLGIFGYPDRDLALATCRAYNDWLADHCAESEGRLYGAAVIPQWDAELAAAEIRRVGDVAVPRRRVPAPEPHDRLEAAVGRRVRPDLAGRERRRSRHRLPSAALGRRARRVPRAAHRRAAARHAVDARRDAARIATARRADGLRQPLLRAGDREPGRHDERRSRS